MKLLPYNACLFIPKDIGENFGITRLQTDNIFNVEMEAFIKKEETEIIKAKAKAKTQTILKINISKDYNNYCIIMKTESIMIVEKNLAEK